MGRDLHIPTCPYTASTRALAVLAAVMALCASGAWAGAAQDSTGMDYSVLPGSEINFLWSALKVGLALLITLVLLVTAVWVLKRFIGPGIKGGGRSITVVDVTYVAPRKAVALIRVLDRVFIVGITEDSMSTLGELSPEDANALDDIQPVQPGGFSSILSSFSHTKGAST